MAVLSSFQWWLQAFRCLWWPWWKTSQCLWTPVTLTCLSSQSECSMPLITQFKRLSRLVHVFFQGRHLHRPHRCVCVISLHSFVYMFVYACVCLCEIKGDKEQRYPFHCASCPPLWHLTIPAHHPGSTDSFLSNAWQGGIKSGVFFCCFFYLYLSVPTPYTGICPAIYLSTGF